MFETGGVEGTYAKYLAHHLGPELAAFKIVQILRLQGRCPLRRSDRARDRDLQLPDRDQERGDRRATGRRNERAEEGGGQWKILVDAQFGAQAEGKLRWRSALRTIIQRCCISVVAPGDDWQRLCAVAASSPARRTRTTRRSPRLLQQSSRDRRPMLGIGTRPLALRLRCQACQMGE